MSAFKQFVCLTAVAAVAIASSGCQKLRARDKFDRGVTAFKAAQYSQAADYFRTAVDLDPNFTRARLYLATAYMSQYIPGAESPENVKNANAAMAEFNKVLAENPDKPSAELAISSIASIYYNQKNWDKTEEWNKKLIELKPDSKEAYYALGVIAWYKWLPPDREARIKSGMKVDDPGPLKYATIRNELKAKWMPILDEGIKDEEKALQIDPNYDNAMAYMSLLIRYRADLLDTPAEYQQQSEIADKWLQKGTEARKATAEKKPEAK